MGEAKRPSFSRGRTMKRVSFFVHCEPVPQPRVKGARRGKRIVLYYDKKTGIEPYKQMVKDAFVGEKLQGPVGCQLLFRFTRPKSHTKKQRQCGWHTGKADIDNCVKAILDALNKIAYDDDKQVAYLQTYKRWTEENQKSGIMIEFWEME